jgi:hypothetical protein
MKTATPASPKQVALIVKLAGERILDGETLLRADNAAALSTKEASSLIDTLFAAPKVPQAQAAPGYYIQDEQVIVVVENKAKTSTYAKRLVISTNGTKKSARWDYAPGLGASLAGYAPLTVEQAAHLGHKHGICMICAKALTDPKSVDAGIGPVCIKKIA